MSDTPDHQLGDARLAYKQAVDQLSNALIRFYSADVPPGSGAPEWTDAQVRAAVALKGAWVHLVETRKAYDDLIFRRSEEH